MTLLPDVATSPDSNLPIRTVLPSLMTSIATHQVSVLVAPPGAGKTTLVPLALADAYDGRVIVAEPRRVAARAAARRMATLVGGRVGEQIGYSVRGQSRVSRDTRVEVVTTGVLLRRLQRDAELPGVAAVMLDECHERHLDTDLALAFLTDVRDALRPDLVVLATSATADADRLAGCLGGSSAAPVLMTPDALFPTDIVWAPPGRPIHPVYGMQVDPRLLDHVAATTRRALHEADGDVLVFLPGVWEINAVAARLEGGSLDARLLTLHGRQPAPVQDAALIPGDRRRIVLATSVAESSLTVPGVRIVVDSGLTREPRADLSRGLSSLVTVRASKATATQRAGRAGRQGPGVVYRCWSAAEHERLAEHAQPEIALADLTGFALEVACWGGSDLRLLDQPPATAVQVARATLRYLGALDDSDRVTARGRSIAAVGAHPRLARALIDGAAIVGGKRAAQIVAILAEDGLAGAGDDLVASWRRLRDGVDRAAAARWRDETRRLSISSFAETASLSDDLAAAYVVALAFPERLAKARTPGARTFLMAGGTAADLAPTSSLTGAEWLAIAVADRPVGSVSARVRLAAATDEATAVEAAAHLLSSHDEVVWRDGDVVARRVRRLGAIVRSEESLNRPDRTLVAAAVAAGLRADGLTLLTWDRQARSLRDRLAFCHQVLGEPWPAVDDASLLQRLDWLSHDLARVRNRADLTRVDVTRALHGLLDWPQATRLDVVAPERVTVPSGSQIRMDYSDPMSPVLPVKIQEAFGWQRAPTVADGRVTVVLHLLSPAGRPAAVTSDLPSFWRYTYPEVRKELRARYPRHPWPEDPTTEPPTRRTQTRRS